MNVYCTQTLWLTLLVLVLVLVLIVAVAVPLESYRVTSFPLKVATLPHTRSQLHANEVTTFQVRSEILLET